MSTAKDMKHEPIDPDLWVDTYGKRLFYFALSRLKNRADAENAVQETFLAALKSRHNFAGQSTEFTWLTGILKHKIVDLIRKNQKYQSTDAVENDEWLAQLFQNNGQWKTPSSEWFFDPAQLTENKEFWLTLQNSLSVLPDKQARAFYMKEVDGFSSEEVCKVLGISSTNLWVLLHRARARLRDCLSLEGFGKGKE